MEEVSDPAAPENKQNKEKGPAFPNHKPWGLGLSIFTGKKTSSSAGWEAALSLFM